MKKITKTKETKQLEEVLMYYRLRFGKDSEAYKNMILIKPHEVLEIFDMRKIRKYLKDYEYFASKFPNTIALDSLCEDKNL